MTLTVTLDITTPEIAVEEVYAFFKGGLESGAFSIADLESIVELTQELIARKKEESGEC